MPTRLFLQQNVLDAARARIQWVFDEFETVYVTVSGGKDSTVCLNLALEEAVRRNRLPLRALFIDQEGEWDHVVRHIRDDIQADPRVALRWLQIPILMNNATSVTQPWLKCWAPGEAWMRAKEPTAMTENVYGTPLFKLLPAAYFKYHYPVTPVAVLYGLRAQESPGRAMGLTTTESYRGVTWGRRFTTGKKCRHFQFAPIYDWTYPDVWRAIHTGGETGTPWPYCKIYDKMWQHGVPILEMRVSNVHHEHATRILYALQEIEPATWNALTTRMAGIHAIGQLQASYYTPETLPPMFASWREYRDYLLLHLTDDTGRAFFVPAFAEMDAAYATADPLILHKLALTQINAILKNDWEEGSMLRTFQLSYPPPDAQVKYAAKRAAYNAAHGTHGLLVQSPVSTPAGDDE